MEDLAMGLDIGTGSAKCVIASPSGDSLWSGSACYSVSRPEPDACEQDPEDWWRAAGAAVRSALSASPDVAARIRAVGVCGQGVAAALVDDSGRPLRPAIIWLDSRCSPQASRLAESAGDRILSVSGKWPGAYNVEPKLLWVREHEPDHWARVWKSMTATAYVTFRLTGRPVMNHSDGGILLAYDLGERCWSDELLTTMGLPRSIYCELKECDDVVGTVTREASMHTGIPAGTPVIAGGEDTSAAALVMNGLRQGIGLLSMGTGGTFNVILERAIADRRLLAFPHVLPGLTLAGGSFVAGGGGLDWVAKLLEGAGDLERLCSAAAAIPPADGRLVFLPYLAGELQPINDGFARGIFFGLDFSTTPAQVMKAVMLGTAFAVAHILEITQEQGAALEEIAAVGGPACNRPLIQAISDVTRLPVRVLEERGGAAFGMAALAATAAGIVSYPANMLRSRSGAVYETVPADTAWDAYQPLFEIYKELYPRLRDLFPKLQPRHAPPCRRQGG